MSYRDIKSEIKNDISKKINFEKPTRQSHVAILLILINIYKKIIKNFWYLLVPLIMGKGNNSHYYLYITIIISVLLTIYSIIDFYKYKFYVKSTDFIVEKGVFSKKKIVIPFDRIQSINFKQHIIHQIFNVVGLELDTAGTGKKEFDFDALDLETSNKLRDYILSHKLSETGNVSNVISPELVKRKLLLKLEIIDLLKIGLTQNHFRSLFIALLSIGWLVDQARQAGLDISALEKITEENIVQLGLYMIAVVFIIALVVIILVSVVRTILKYYDYLMIRNHNGFKIEHGLLNRNEVSVMDNKIQVLLWSDNLLRRSLGLFTLQIKLASSMNVKQKKSIIIPGINAENINNIKSYYFSDETLNRVDSFSSDSYYLYRRLAIVIALFLISTFLTLKLIEGLYYLIPIVLMMFFILSSFLKFNKLKFSINDEILQIGSGVFGHKQVLLYLYKLQGVKLTQSPIQQRKGLSDVIVYSAAGKHRLRYIDMELAIILRDYIQYRVESDDRPWM